VLDLDDEALAAEARRRGIGHTLRCSGGDTWLLAATASGAEQALTADQVLAEAPARCRGPEPTP
ncbi:MAG: hypothetical protein P8129_16470, partial [Anaerolineae bacterium]